MSWNWLKNINRVLARPVYSSVASLYICTTQRDLGYTYFVLS